MRALLTTAAALAAGLALVACGGGSDYDAHPEPVPNASTAVPYGAIASAPALVSYLNGQSFSDDSSEVVVWVSIVRICQSWGHEAGVGVGVARFSACS